MKQKNVIGLDLGSQNTIIYNVIEDLVVFNEPTIIAKNKQNNQILEIGYLANKLEGRNPYNIKISKFVKNGLLHNREDCLNYLKFAISSMHLEKLVRNSTLILACSDDLSMVHQEALISICKDLDISSIYMESISKLTALGSGLNISNMHGNLIVNIGSGSTNIGIISSGELVKGKTIPIGGDNFDIEIVRYIRNKWKTRIGLKTSEQIKIKIGTLDETQEEKFIEVKGQDLITGLPHSFVISNKELINPLTKVANDIIFEIQQALEDVNPELISDISTNGITISGGSALLQGSRKFYQKSLHLPSFTSPTPSLSVVKGMKELLNQAKYKEI